MTTPALAQPAEMTTRARQFVADHEQHIRPLEIAVALAWWNANVSGKDSDFKAKEEAQNKLDEALANTNRFAELKTIHQAKLSDPLLARQVDVLYRTYLEKQLDPNLLKRMTAKANAI
jgi:peptidyl-dipeptidase A